MHKLVIFCGHYPYGIMTEFIDDEIKIAEQFFESIKVVTLEKRAKTITQYVPANAEIILLRKDYTVMRHALGLFKAAMSFSVIRAAVETRRLQPDISVMEALKTAVIDKSIIDLLAENEAKWIDDEAVFYSFWLSGSASYLALNKERLRGPVISRAHGGDCFADRAAHPYRKEQFERLDAIFPVSDAGTADLIKQGCPAEKVRTARLGVPKSSEKMNPWTPSQKKNIVTCSNIIQLKRLDLLIDAISQIEDIDIHWIHFGDGSMREAIESYACEKLHGKANISYEFKGRVQKAEILRFYEEQSVDLFVNCSDHEGVPVSVMEAMSYSIPVIARDIGGNSEILEDGLNGILLPAECIAQMLSEKISELLLLPEAEQLSLRRFAFETYDSKYSADKNYRKFWGDIIEQYKQSE